MHQGEIIIVGLSADAEDLAARLRQHGRMASAVPSLGLARVNPGALIIMDTDIVDPIECARMVFDCEGHLICLGSLDGDGESLAELEARARAKGLIFQTGFRFHHDPGLHQVRDWLRGDEFGALEVIHCESYTPSIDDKPCGPDTRQLALSVLLLDSQISGVQHTRCGAVATGQSTYSLCQLHTKDGPRAVLSRFKLHPVQNNRILLVGANATCIWSAPTDDVERLSLHPAHGAASENLELDRDASLDAIADGVLRVDVDAQADIVSIPGGLSGLLTCIEEASVHGEYVAMSETNSDYFVHPTSVVDGPVEIGKGTRIWHFSKLLGPLTIGESCTFGQNVVVERNVEIGRNVKIQNNVSVYSGVILEDDVFCGPSMVFTNVGTPRSAYPRKGQYLETRVRQGASIGANATVVCGNTLGRYSFVGAGSVVTRDVPDYALVYGNPAKIRGWSCFCGERLNMAVDEKGQEQTSCEQCGRSYSRNGLRVQPID